MPSDSESVIAYRVACRCCSCCSRSLFRRHVLLTIPRSRSNESGWKCQPNVRGATASQGSDFFLVTEIAGYGHPFLPRRWRIDPGRAKAGDSHLEGAVSECKPGEAAPLVEAHSPTFAMRDEWARPHFAVEKAGCTAEKICRGRRNLLYFDYLSL